MSKITTNHHWRFFKYRNEVPKKILDSQFDHLDEDQHDSFLKYKGTWYHISDFLRDGIKEWDGHHAHSYSYAVVIRISDDCESYQIGTWIS